jgi:hypothetical protein
LQNRGSRAGSLRDGDGESVDLGVSECRHGVLLDHGNPDGCQFHAVVGRRQLPGAACRAMSGTGEGLQIDWQARRTGLHWSSTHPGDRTMPIRIASLTKRISRNGALLHKATRDRILSLGENHEPSEAEQALVEERRLLKEERAKRQARALQPKAKAIDKLVRTHHPQAKEKPKAKKEPKEAKADKPHKPSRAEKHTAKAAAKQAATRAPKKQAHA